MGEKDGFGHGDVLERNKGNDVDHSDKGVDPGVLLDIEQLQRPLRQVKSPLLHLGRGTDKGHDRAVVVGIGMKVKDTGGLDRGNDLLDQAGVRSFGKIEDAFN